MQASIQISPISEQQHSPVDLGPTRPWVRRAFMASGPRPRRILVVCSDKAMVRPDLSDGIATIAGQGHHIERIALSALGGAWVLASLVRAGGYDAVVAAGGDGTLNAVANAIVAAGVRQTALAVLPFGTANDFAHGTGAARLSTAQTLALVATGRPVAMDLGRVNGRLFVNCASGGLTAEVTTQTPKTLKRWLGGAAYIATGFAISISKRPARVRLRGPDFEWVGNALYLGISNAPLAGGGLSIAPKASISDQRLDVTVVPSMSFRDTRQVVSGLVFDKALAHERVISRQVSWLEVETPEPFQINTDGEPMRERQYRFDVLGRQVPCFLPGRVSQ